MTADTYVAHLLAIREARSLRELQQVRRALPPAAAGADPQTRFLREQLAERELEIAAALTP